MKGIYGIFESIGKFADPLIGMWENNKWRIIGLIVVGIIVIMMSVRK